MGPTDLHALHQRLGVTGEADIARLGRAISDTPPRWSELADAGHRTELGKHLRHTWRDYTRPTGYLSVREVAGHALLISALLDEGLIPHGSYWAPMLEHCPAWRYLSRDLAYGWAAAPVVEPDGIALRLPWVIAILPPDIELEQGSDLVALSIGMRTAENGAIELSWGAIGTDIGIAGLDRGWHATPSDDICSRIAWGIAATLGTEPMEVHVDRVDDIPQGLIRNPRERPAPAWIEPPIRRITSSLQPISGRGGTVAPHWRAGHRRKQRCGKGLKEWKWIYIAPIWVDPRRDQDSHGEDLAA